MKRIILILLFLLAFVAFLRLNAQWSKCYGGKNNDAPYSIQQTFDGGFIAVGLTKSFGRDDGDFWVLKLSPRGEIDWQNTYGGENYESAKCVQQTTDGGYIVAGNIYYNAARQEDSWILKLSSDGEVEWQKTYGGSENDEASCIRQTVDGGYIVAGFSGSFGTKGPGTWVSKLSSDGEVEWQKTYGGSASDYATCIQQTVDGGYIVAGYTYSFGAGSDDLLILKLYSDGEIEWQKTYGGSKEEKATYIQQTMDGGYIVAGAVTFFYSRTEYNEDVWILKLSPAGDIVWQHIYMGDYNDSVQSLQQTVDGGYIVAVGIGKDLYEDFLVLKLSPNGEIEWQRAYGCARGDYAHSIQQTDDGGYIVAGETGFFGGEHFWIFKLFPNGEIPSICDLAKTVSLKTVDTDIIPQDSTVTIQDTNIIPQDSNISPNPTEATVYDFCSGKYFLNIEAWPGGTTDPLPGIYTYDPGTEVTIKATPSNGHFLEFWGGDASGNSNTVTITMNSHKIIIAAFMPGAGESRNFGHCFIATAAYGSPIHPYVKLLRDFRDKYIIPKKLGRTLIRIYYRYSPPLACFMEKHKAMKAVVRVSLLPFIAFSYSMLHFGLIGTATILILIFSLPALLVWRYRRRLKRGKRIAKDKISREQEYML